MQRSGALNRDARGAGHNSPVSKHTTWHSLALWHGKGQLRAAASDESPIVKIYFASDSVRNSRSNLLQ